MPTTTADITTPLTSAETALTNAHAQTLGALDHTDTIQRQAQARGLGRLFANMDRVKNAFEESRDGFATAITAAGDARGPVGAIADGDTPAEVTARLNTSIASISAAVGTIDSVYPALDEAEAVTKQALDGGEQGPLLRFVKLANEYAAEARQHASTAKEKATAFLAEVANLGN